MGGVIEGRLCVPHLSLRACLLYVRIFLRFVLSKQSCIDVVVLGAFASVCFGGSWCASPWADESSVHRWSIATCCLRFRPSDASRFGSLGASIAVPDWSEYGGGTVDETGRLRIFPRVSAATTAPTTPAVAPEVLAAATGRGSRAEAAARFVSSLVQHGTLEQVASDLNITGGNSSGRTRHRIPFRTWDGFAGVPVPRSDLLAHMESLQTQYSDLRPEDFMVVLGYQLSYLFDDLPACVTEEEIARMPTFAPLGATHVGPNNLYIPLEIDVSHDPAYPSCTVWVLVQVNRKRRVIYL